MSTDAEIVLDAILESPRLKAMVEEAATKTTRFGKVAQVSPLLVQIDGDTTNTPVVKTDSAVVALNNRAIIQRVNGHYTLVGTLTGTDSDSGGGGGKEVGEITMWLTDTPPEAHVFVRGDDLSRTVYPDLFARWGTTFGVGDGSTTFGTPDMRSRVPLGKDSRDTDFNALGKLYGAKTHSLIAAQNGPHAHGGAFYVYNLVEIGGVNTGGAFSDTGMGRYGATGSSGSGEAHNNTQLSLVVNFIVKAANSAGQPPAASLEYVTNGNAHNHDGGDGGIIPIATGVSGEWVSWTPVVSAQTTAPTLSGATTGKYRKMPKSLDGTIDFGAVTANGNGLYLFSLPAGITIDTTVDLISTIPNAGAANQIVKTVVGTLAMNYGNTSSAWGTAAATVHVYDSTHLCACFTDPMNSRIYGCGSYNGYAGVAMCGHMKFSVATTT